MLLTGVIFLACSTCFLTHPGPPAHCGLVLTTAVIIKNMPCRHLMVAPSQLRFSPGNSCLYHWQENKRTVNNWNPMYAHSFSCYWILLSLYDYPIKIQKCILISLTCGWEYGIFYRILHELMRRMDMLFLSNKIFYRSLISLFALRQWFSTFGVKMYFCDPLVQFFML